ALLPGMYGQARIAVALGRQLVIPAGAVLQTGDQPLAFVDQGGGRLAPRPVELGTRVGDLYVVRGGLRPGERIARDASFLIASEEQMSAGAGSYAPPPPGVGAAGPQAGARLELTTAPSPPRAGANLFRVRLTSAGGSPLAGAQVSLTLYRPAMPAMGMAASNIVVALADQGGGLYEGRGNVGGGTWQATITATRQGQALARQQRSLVVVGGM
ncbi:MAG TPA: FixH family protein, partial [Terriglobales bacterium]|nr:FixH family protein [Terriglobales bacterium]